MNVRLNASTLVAKSFLLLFAFMVIGIFLLQAPLCPTSANGQERVFEDAIPKDVPIRLRIRKEKEKSFRDLKDPTWVREFELEVKNTGNKTIYFLFLDLITDVKVGGDPLVFSLMYGRAALGDIVSKAKSDDAAIAPGETYVFKIHPGQVPAWEQSVLKQSHAQATMLRAELQSMSFGDGTGYFGNHPYPAADEHQLLKHNQNHHPIPDRPKARAWPANRSGTAFRSALIVDTPVSSLPAYFFYGRAIKPCRSSG